MDEEGTDYPGGGLGSCPGLVGPGSGPWSWPASWSCQYPPQPPGAKAGRSGRSASGVARGEASRPTARRVRPTRVPVPFARACPPSRLRAARRGRAPGAQIDLERHGALVVGVPARSWRNASRSSTPCPGGRWESHPFPALSDRWTCRSRSPKRWRTSIGSCRATAAWEVSSARWCIPSRTSRSWFEWNVRSLPATRTGKHVLDRDRDAGALLDAREVVDERATERALPSIGRVHHDHRDAGVRRGLDGAVELRTGSVPQTFRVSSKHGACSAPTASSNSSARARMLAGSWLSPELS